MIDFHIPGGNYNHAFNASVLITVLTTGASFYFCNKDHESKRAIMKKTFDEQNIKESK